MIDIFAAIIEYGTLFTYLWIYFKINPDRKIWRYICHIVMPVSFFLFSNYIIDAHLRPILFILCSWFIALNFEGNIWQRIFSVSVFQIILILWEFAISYLVSPAGEFFYIDIYLFSNIFAKFTTVGILFILFLYSKKNRIVFLQSNPIHIFILLSFSSTSFFLVMIIDYLILALGQTKLFIIEFIVIFLAIATNIGLYYLFYQLSIGEEAKNRLKFINFHMSQQKESQTYMEQSYQELRRISHDMNHYLTVILTLLEQNNVEQAKQDLQQKQIEINNNQLFDTGYPVLNSVITIKIKKAQKNQIQIQLFWNLKESILINLTDVAIILANGLDNAIEAAKQVQTTQPFIQITAETVGQYLRLKISNNTVSAPVIKDGKIITTKQDKFLHGIGLESIKILAQRYEGESFTTYDNHIFTLTIILRNALIQLEE